MFPQIAVASFPICVRLIETSLQQLSVGLFIAEELTLVLRHHRLPLLLPLIVPVPLLRIPVVYPFLLILEIGRR